MTDAPAAQFVNFAHQLVAHRDDDVIRVGPLHAEREGNVWTVWLLRDDERAIYLDTLRPTLWASAADLNTHLQQLAPLEPADDVDDSESGPTPPRNAFQ